MRFEFAGLNGILLEAPGVRDGENLGSGHMQSLLRAFLPGAPRGSAAARAAGGGREGGTVLPSGAVCGLQGKTPAALWMRSLGLIFYLFIYFIFLS